VSPFCPGDPRPNLAGPNQAWTGDITYIASEEGWLFLAVVIDLFSRKVVGWSMRAGFASQPGDRRAGNGPVSAQSAKRPDDLSQ